MAGVVPTELTNRYLQQMFEQIYTGNITLSCRCLTSCLFSMVSAEMKTNKIILTIENLYEVIGKDAESENEKGEKNECCLIFKDILSKIIHQIGVYALYPVLSLMYNDG